MTSTDEYYDPIVDKLKDNAAPNSDVSSEAKEIQGSTLLSEAQEVLPALDKEAQVMIARHDAQRYEAKKSRIAPAPHERLPEDVLLEIFSYLSEGVLIPPVLTQLPWILGRVCSRWRSISRSDSRLWGCPVFEFLSQSNLLKSIQVLPPIAHISVKYRTDTNFDSLLPVLNRCKSLELVGSVHSLDNFWKAIPHNAFINLQRLFISIVDFRHYYPEPDWDFTAGPLHMVTQLRSVTLYSKWADSTLSIGIPWSQLKYLKVVSLSNTSALRKVLQQCNSVVELCLTVEKPCNFKSAVESTNDLYLPHLRKLDVSTFNVHPWILMLSNWEHLTFLNLFGVYSPNDLQHILQKCINLHELHLSVPQDFPLKTLNMPFLRSLHIETYAQSRPPALNNLILPGLEELTIIDGWFLGQSSFSGMLEASHCSLSYFEYLGPTNLPHSLLDILSSIAISSTMITVIFLNSVFPAHVLHDIGLGILLPKLNTLICIPETVDAMLNMLEARVDREVQVRGHASGIMMHITVAERHLSEMQAGRLHDLHCRVSHRINTTILIQLIGDDISWRIALADNADHLDELMRSRPYHSYS